MLSKRSTHTMEEIKKVSPDMNGIYYTTRYVASEIDFDGTYAEFLGVLETLKNENQIRWADSDHTVFALNEAASSYKEIIKLERSKMRKERLYGFLSGFFSGLLLWGTTEFISWIIKTKFV